MALITAAAVAAELGIVAPDATGTRFLRHYAIAVAHVDAYLRGGDCPEHVRDEAVIRTTSHVRTKTDERFGEVRTGGGIRITTGKSGSPVRQSGAAALLAPYVNWGSA